MSASLDRRGMLDALNEADDSHPCPAAAYTFVEHLGEVAIRCVGCGDIIWQG